MGNEISSLNVDVNLLRGDVIITQSFLCDVTIHHSTQKELAKYRILQLKRVDRSTDIYTQLKPHSLLIPLFESEFQSSNLLARASIPATCRHPSILRIHRPIPDPVNHSLFLLTESCLPLHCLLNSCTAIDILLGMRSILIALDFVHSQLSSSHNNLRVSSIFVASSPSDWKLGGFEFTMSFNQMSSEVIQLLELLHSEPPKTEAIVFASEHPFCYDVYAFSRFFVRLVSDLEDDLLFQDFLQVLRKSCMHSDTRLRIPPGQLLLHSLFRHPLIVASDFLEQYMTQRDSEKVKFFRDFEKNVASNLPIDVLCQSVLSKCLDSNIFLDPPSQPLICQILHPFDDTAGNSSGITLGNSRPSRSFLPQSAFKLYLCPLILAKFHIHERLTRMILLENFLGYVHLFPSNQLRDVILPEVCLGVYDSYDPLCSLSLHAVGQLSLILGGSVALNVLRQTELRLQHEGKFVKRKSATRWPQGRLFAEAAPKISRQQREMPECEQKANGPSLSLARLASLSASYDPNSNPLLQQFVEDPDGPKTIKGNANKLACTPSAPTNVPQLSVNPKKTTPPRNFESAHPPSPDHPTHSDTGLVDPEPMESATTCVGPPVNGESGDWGDGWDCENWD